MHSVESYLRRQSTEKLRSIILADFEGTEKYLPDVIVMVCKILAERDPPTKSAEEMFREFQRDYGMEFEVENEDL